MHILHVLPDLVVSHILGGAQCGVVQLSAEHEEGLAIDDELARSLGLAKVGDTGRRHREREGWTFANEGRNSAI